MALEIIVGQPAAQKGRFVYTSKMNEGESVSGYLVGFKEGKAFGNEAPNPIIVLKTKAGETLDVFTSSTLKHVQKDAAGRLITGVFTVITKTASYKNKRGTMSSKFSVAQDKEDTIDTTTASATTTTPAAGSVEERLANLKKRA